MLRWQHEYVLMKSLLSSDLQQWLRHCFVSCFNHMNSEETTRAVTGRRIQMTVMTFHRELESGAVFHISPTRFHVRIRKKRGKELLLVLVLSPRPSSLLLWETRTPPRRCCCSKFHEFSKKKKSAAHESHYTLRNRNDGGGHSVTKKPELCTDVPQRGT